MRLGTWRGAILALGLALAIGRAAPAVANDTWWNWNPTIPRVAPAVDYRTGGPFYAPPVPYGHYAKDYLGSVHKCLGAACGLLHCGLCAGRGCGHCGGKGLHCGNQGCGSCNHGGLLHHGKNACGACGGAGCGLCGGGAIGGPIVGGGGAILPGTVVVGPVGAGHGHHGGAGPLCDGPNCASAQGSVSAPVVVSGCGACGGQGCGLCGRGKHHGHGHGDGLMQAGACGACGGKGCGLCGGDPLCNACGGKGCGLCGGKGKHCGRCFGKGCSACLGWLYTLTHPRAGRINWFLGAGGPVPLTPGYVPYVVPVRSPRDYFAFPPYNEFVDP